LGIGPFGSDLKVSDYCDVGVPLVFVRNIRSGDFGAAGDKYISPAKAEALRAHRVQPGDLLITKMGTPPGDVCLYPETQPDGVMTADCIRLRINPDFPAAKFFLYAFRTEAVRDQILSRTGGVAQQKITLEKFRSVRVPVAPMGEAARIVAAIEQHLSDIDAGEAGLERALINLKRYRAAVLNAACEGRLVPIEAEIARTDGSAYEPGEVLLQRILTERRARWEEKQLAKMTAKGQVPSDERWKAKYDEPTEADEKTLPQLPQGWVWTLLRNVAQLKGGVTKGQKRVPGEATQAVPYLRVANVQRGYLDLTEVKEIEAAAEDIDNLRLMRGDVLFNEGGDRDKLGRGWIWEEQLPLMIHQNHVFRARLFDGLGEPKFLSWYGNSLGQKYFVDEGKQTTNLASINMTKLGALPVPLPPLAEQRRIVAEVDRILSVADATEQATRAQLARAKRLRQAVLKCAFEGKLVPQVSGEESSDLLVPAASASSPPATTSLKKTNGAVPNMRPRTPKTPEHASDFRPLEDILTAHASPMTPEALFSAAGYAADHVDAFYTELRRLELAGRIEEVRSAARLIRLRKAES
jgi:type I restriction enzyme S subunit